MSSRCASRTAPRCGERVLEFRWLEPKWLPFHPGSVLRAPGSENGPRGPKTTKNRGRRANKKSAKQVALLFRGSVCFLSSRRGGYAAPKKWCNFLRRFLSSSVFRRFRFPGAVFGPQGPQKRIQDEKLPPGKSTEFSQIFVLSPSSLLSSSL